MSGNQLPVQDAIKALNYQLDKQSVINPFHQVSNKQPAKQSSKTKAQVIQVEARPVSESDIQAS